MLCIHGFTGTPYEVRPLGEALAERGFTAVGPMLPGHGDNPHAVNRTTWRDWVAAMAGELDALRRRCRRVGLIGMSLGGLIALQLAARAPDIAALCVMGTPLWLPAWSTASILGLRLLAPRLASVPKAGADIRDPAARASFPTMRAFPLQALHSVLDLAVRVRAGIGSVRAPALVIHADHDHVAPPACAPELLARLGSTDKRLLRLPRSYHIVAVDVDRDLVAREVGDFFTSRM